VIPAVDVLDGEVVRLRRGDFGQRFLESGEPGSVIGSYATAGAPLIHVVDLAGARDGRLDRSLIAEVIVAAGDAAVQFAGGVRTVTDAAAALSLGASRVVIGTAALAEDGVRDFVAALGDRLVVAIDVRAGAVVTKGWLHSSGRSPEDVARYCRDEGVARILCTAVERDGMLGGPDVALLERVVAASGLPVIASGGVGSLEDIDALERAGLEACVVGRALLDGTLSAADLFATAG
jgi:phosphoribosylformimino-5-aminoimidazole carboxamide ribotide isomerase